jgi:hypothetical protein
MKKTDPLELLKENVKDLQNAMAWLQRSYGICKQSFDLNNLSPEGMDAFEGLTSRFARVTDILFSKVFRSIAYIEEGESRSWLDVLLYMEKKGVIGDAVEARTMKELRNEIVHEYSTAEITNLFGEVLLQCPVLFGYAENAIREAELLEKKI